MARKANFLAVHVKSINSNIQKTKKAAVFKAQKYEEREKEKMLNEKSLRKDKSKEKR